MHATFLAHLIFFDLLTRIIVIEKCIFTLEHYESYQFLVCFPDFHQGLWSDDRLLGFDTIVPEELAITIFRVTEFAKGQEAAFQGDSTLPAPS